jgi:hypothetical protein
LMDELVLNRRRSSRLAPPASPEQASTRHLLWGSDDLLRWAFAILAAAIVIGVAWYVAAGDLSLNQQIGPMDAAVAGLVVSGFGNATWLLRGRRAIGERRRALLPDPIAQVQRARLAREQSPTPVVGVLGTITPAEGAETFLAGPDLERYHRPTCALAAGRAGWTTMTRQEHVAAGRNPCGVCQP